MRRWLLIFVFAGSVVGAEPPPLAPKQPFFQLATKAKQGLIEKANSLKSGDSYQTVIDRLGLPTSDKVLMRKENSKVIGRSLKYYAVRWEAGLVNETHDQFVDVFLDEKNRIQSIQIKVEIGK